MSAYPGIWQSGGEKLVDRLKELFLSGVSCADIAFELTKEFNARFTRNAVIGKAHRLGLVSPHAGKKGYNGSHRAARSAKEFGYRPRPKLVSAAPRRPEPVTPATPLHVEFMDIKRGQCRYPFGDGPYTFCGCEAVTGRPYCAHHMDLCTAQRHEKNSSKSAHFASRRKNLPTILALVTVSEEAA